MRAEDRSNHHVCPWYMAYLFDNPLRTLIHRSERVLGPYVLPGMTVLDVGCGMGFFSIGMARMLGPGGRVIALDLQEKMLRVLESRARRAGLEPLIDRRLVDGTTLPVEEVVDFALGFWVVHELPDQAVFFRELARVLRPGGRVFVAEPLMHVKSEDLEKTVQTARNWGFSASERPRVSLSRAVVLVKTSDS